MKTKQEAFEKLAPIARRVASMFRARLPAHECVDDIENVALMGVWEAVTRHFGKSEQELTGQAVVRARGAIRDFMRTRDWATRNTRRIKAPFTMLSLDMPREDLTQRVHEVLRANETPEDLTDEHEEATMKASALAYAFSLLRDRDSYVVRRLLAGAKAVAVAKELGFSQPRITQIMARVLPLVQAAVREYMKGYEKRLK